MRRFLIIFNNHVQTLLNALFALKGTIFFFYYFLRETFEILKRQRRFSFGMWVCMLQNIYYNLILRVSVRSSDVKRVKQLVGRIFKSSDIVMICRLQHNYLCFLIEMYVFFFFFYYFFYLVVLPVLAPLLMFWSENIFFLNTIRLFWICWFCKRTHFLFHNIIMNVFQKISIIHC